MGRSEENFGRSQLKRIADEDDEAESEKEAGRKRPSRRRIIPLDEAKARLLEELEESGKLRRVRED